MRCRPTAINIVYSFNTNSRRKYCESPWLQRCCCWPGYFGKNCLCSFIWLVYMLSIQNQQTFICYYELFGMTILFVFAVITGLLIRLIGLLGKILIPRCKLECWIFMVLSASRIIGKLVSVTCHLYFFVGLWKVKVSWFIVNALPFL